MTIVPPSRRIAPSPGHGCSCVSARNFLTGYIAPQKQERVSLSGTESIAGSRRNHSTHNDSITSPTSQLLYNARTRSHPGRPVRYAAALPPALAAPKRPSPAAVSCRCRLPAATASPLFTSLREVPAPLPPPSTSRALCAPRLALGPRVQVICPAAAPASSTASPQAAS